MGRTKIIVVSIVIIINLLIIGFAYFITPFPMGRKFFYEFSIEISFEQDEVQLIVPIPISEEYKASSVFDYEEAGIDIGNTIETEYGLGLLLTLNNPISIHIEGVYNAYKRLVGYREDNMPILSMSTLNHTYHGDNDLSQSLMVNSSHDDIEFKISLRNTYFNMKSWSLFSYHIRGGGGKNFVTENELKEGWNCFPIEVFYTDVD